MMKNAVAAAASRRMIMIAPMNIWMFYHRVTEVPHLIVGRQKSRMMF